MSQLIYITGHEGFIGTALRKMAGAQAAPWHEDAPAGKALIHLAGRVGVAENSKRLLVDVWDELDMHRKVFNWVSKTQTPLFLASSSEVYGSSEQPMKESDLLRLQAPGNPRWMYARIKALHEQAALQLSAETGIPVTIGRFFNVCGPGQFPASGMVMARLVSNALKNVPLVIYGNGLQKRTFTHIEDASSAILALASSPSGNRIVNIGTRNTTTVLDLAGKILSLTGSRSELFFEPSPYLDIASRVPDISVLENLLPDWDPKSLDRIILDTAEFFRNSAKN